MFSDKKSILVENARSQILQLHNPLKVPRKRKISASQTSLLLTFSSQTTLNILCITKLRENTLSFCTMVIVSIFPLSIFISSSRDPRKAQTVKVVNQLQQPSSSNTILTLNCLVVSTMQ